MFFERKEEEVFLKREVEKEKEGKLLNLIKRLESITHQVGLIVEFLSTISKKVDKTVKASSEFRKELDDLERRIESLRSKVDELEATLPEVKLAKKRRRAG